MAEHLVIPIPGETPTAFIQKLRETLDANKEHKLVQIIPIVHDGKTKSLIVVFEHDEVAING